VYSILFLSSLNLRPYGQIEMRYCYCCWCYYCRPATT